MFLNTKISLVNNARGNLNTFTFKLFSMLSGVIYTYTRFWSIIDKLSNEWEIELFAMQYGSNAPLYFPSLGS